MTGEGIAQALLTGRWAAEAISRRAPADRSGGPATTSGTVRAELFADHRMSPLLSRALSHRKGARIALRLAGVHRLDPAQLRPLAVRGLPPGRRCGRPAGGTAGMFSGPGAYRN